MEYIEKVSIENFETVMELMNLAKKNLRSNNISQWSGNYPDGEILKKDILDRNMYGYYINGLLAGFAVLTMEKNIYYFRRVTVHPEYTGRKISGKLIEFIENIIKKGIIISSTGHENIYMKRVLEKNNFIWKKKTVIKGRENEGIFYIYEKKLNM